MSQVNPKIYRPSFLLHIMFRGQHSYNCFDIIESKKKKIGVENNEACFAENKYLRTSSSKASWIKDDFELIVNL